MGSLAIVVAFRPPTRCAWMSQLPLTRTAYATVPPSGESVGDFSSPASSLTRVNWLHGASRGAAALLVNHAPAAIIAAIAATLQGSHGTAGRAAGRIVAAAVVADVEDDTEGELPVSVSSAKARSFADWKRSSGVF